MSGDSEPTQRRVNNEKFLQALKTAVRYHPDAKTLFMTMKRYTRDTADLETPESTGNEQDMTTATDDTTKQYPCLLRIKTKEVKVSTLVQAQDVNAFLDAYAQILRADMTGLKARNVRGVPGNYADVVGKAAAKKQRKKNKKNANKGNRKD